VGTQGADALQALRAEVGTQVADALQQQADALQALRAEVGAQGADALQQQADALQALRLEAEKGAAERDARMVEWERTVARLKTEIILQERRITILLEEARKRLPDPWNQEQVQSVADEVHHVLDALYVSFEDQFRGTREDIKERLRLYLPILQEAKLGSETRPILDVGCGRGEWLELLQENGMWGQGVDRNRVLVEKCRGHGLCVVESDVLTYLRTLPDASLGAVTGFHIIEHLPWEVLIKVLDETVRVLTSGGLAIFETPNPQNVLVGSHNFYLDPTHRNPLPSSVMQFIAEARGLCRVQIIELHPYPQASRVQEADLDVAKRFNKYFYGPQDYAVVGWKA
jgi:SAM-dependent methyltransferase